MDDIAAQGGLVSALVATWTRSVFGPAEFFQRLRPDAPVGGALGFGSLCCGVGGLLGALELAAIPLIKQEPVTLNALYYGAVAMVVAALSLLVAIPIIHAALAVVGGARNGIGATARAVGYSAGPLLFAVVPLVGRPVGTIWSAVISVIALSSLHRIQVSKVLAAIGAVVVFICCGSCIIGAAIGWGVSDLFTKPW